MIRIALALLLWTTAALAAPADDLVAEGKAALKAVDIVAAMTAFTRALDADPAHSEAAYERGRILLTIGEPAQAVADFTTAVLSDPKNGRAFARRGEAKMILKNAEAAFADFDVAVAASPRDYEVLVIRATFRLRGGDLAGAKADLAAAKAVADPANASAIQKMLDRLN